MICGSSCWRHFWFMTFDYPQQPGSARLNHMRDAESHSQPDLFSAEEEKEPLFGYTLPDYILAVRRPEALAMIAGDCLALVRALIDRALDAGPAACLGLEERMIGALSGYLNGAGVAV